MKDSEAPDLKSQILLHTPIENELRCRCGKETPTVEAWAEHIANKIAEQWPRNGEIW